MNKRLLATGGAFSALFAIVILWGILLARNPVNPANVSKMLIGMPRKDAEVILGAPADTWALAFPPAMPDSEKEAVSAATWKDRHGQMDVLVYFCKADRVVDVAIGDVIRPDEDLLRRARRFIGLKEKRDEDTP